MCRTKPSEVLARVECKLDLILFCVRQILNKERSIMASLDEVLADVTAETTALDGVLTLIQGLKDQIAGLSLPPDVQAKVDAVFAAAEANKAKIATALAANVPPPTP